MDIISQGKHKGSLKTERKALSKWFNREVKAWQEIDNRDFNSYVQYQTPYSIDKDNNNEETDSGNYIDLCDTDDTGKPTGTGL